MSLFVTCEYGEKQVLYCWWLPSMDRILFIDTNSSYV